MNRIQSFVVLCNLLSGLPSAVYASQEGGLLLSDFQLSSPGIGQSGPVVVSGTGTTGAIKSICVRAFNRTQCLSKEQLAKLGDGIFNGVQLSYEEGYQELGGRTVYVLLSKGFTSARLQSKVISVTEKGRIEIQDAPAK